MKHEKCDDVECCCKCIHQYEIYPFKPKHFHQVGGFICLAGHEDEPEKRWCAHFKDGHGLCEVFGKDSD